MTAALECVDVSPHQTNAQLQAICADPGLWATFVKVTEGNGHADDPDCVIPQAQPWLTLLRNAGKRTAAYHFARPENNPVDEGRWFAKYAQPRVGMTLWVDFEPYDQRYAGADETAWLPWIIACLRATTTAVQPLQVNVGVYMDPSMLARVIGDRLLTDPLVVELCTHPLWLAAPGPTMPLIGGFQTVCWQYDWHKQVAGGDVDADRWLTGPDGWDAIAVKESKPVTYYTACGYPALASFPASFVAPNGHVTDVANKDFATIMSRLWWTLTTEIDSRIGVSRGGSTIAEQEQIYRNLGLPCNYTSNHLGGYANDGGNGRQVFEPNQIGSYRSGYSASQERQIDAILARAEYGGILQWGHHFASPYRDPVHFQLRQRYLRGSGPWAPVVSRAQIAAVAKGIRTWVKAVQIACGVTADGVAGPGTISAVKAWQKAHGLTADGIVGTATEKVMFAPPTPKPTGDLVVDGEFGPTSVATLQHQLGLTPDGKISSQSTSARRLVRHGILPAAIEYVAPSRAKGSQTVVALQVKVGIKHPTGKLTKPTIRAIQTFLSEHGFVLDEVNGIWDKPMSVRMQRALNRGLFK